MGKLWSNQDVLLHKRSITSYGSSFTCLRSCQAADTLNIESLQNIISGVLNFIPNIIAFVLIIAVGLLLVDYFSDFISSLGKNADINLLEPINVLLRLFLYFIVIMLALTQLHIQLDIIYAFLVPLAWGVGLGIGAAIAIYIWVGPEREKSRNNRCTS